jgi:hypothetical protein
LKCAAADFVHRAAAARRHWPASSKNSDLTFPPTGRLQNLFNEYNIMSESCRGAQIGGKPAETVL